MATKKQSAKIKLESSYERYYPYLMELRRRLLFIVAIFIVGGGVGLFYYERIVRLILNIFNFEGINIVFTSPFQYVTLAINSGLIVGLVFVFPLIIAQLLSFMKPALKNKEFKTTASLMPASIFLFIFGFAFGIFIMRYVVLIFYERSIEFDIGNFLDISLLLSQTLITSLLMGIAFQFPIVLTILLRLRVFKYAELAKQRLIAYSASIVFAAFLPPTDLFSLVLLTLPLVVLFEFTLLFNRGLLKASVKRGES